MSWVSASAGMTTGWSRRVSNSLFNPLSLWERVGVRVRGTDHFTSRTGVTVTLGGDRKKAAAERMEAGSWPSSTTANSDRW